MLTAYHVVDEPDGAIEVYVGETKYEGEIVDYADEPVDIAVITICCGDFTPLLLSSWGGEEDQMVMVMGRPTDEVEVRLGFVEESEGFGVDALRLLYHDTGAGKGFSGAPLIDMYGTVIGVMVGEKRGETGIDISWRYGGAIEEMVESWSK